MSDDQGGIEYFEDAGGNKIKYFTFGGVPMPAFPGDQGMRMRRLKEFPVREDDVFVCGYPKSGGNWAWEICQMLQTGRAEYFPGNKMAAMLEFMNPEHFETVSSPRCLSYHFRFQDIPPDTFTKRAKIVYVLRNPKDVCVSHYHHNKGLIGIYDYHGNWPDYFEMWLEGRVDYGKWSTYVKGWEKGMKTLSGDTIYLLRYESLKMDFEREVRKLTKFLGLSRSEEFFLELSRKCNFATMKQLKTEIGYTKQEKGAWRNGDIKFLRKGVVGDWKNHFTVAQNERFNEMYDREMKDSDLEFVFES